MNYQNFVEIENKKRTMLFIYSSLLLIVFFSIGGIYIFKNQRLIKINNINSVNDYLLQKGEFIDELKSNFRGELSYNGTFSPSDFENVNFQNPNSLTPIQTLSISIDLECDEIIHIKITDKDNKRWESPYTISESYTSKVAECKNTKSLEDVGFYIYSVIGEKFYYYYHTDDDNTILTSENSRFLFSDNFILFGHYLTSNFVAGFGERYHDFNLGDGLYTSWPNDTSGIHPDDGKGAQSPIPNPQSPIPNLFI